MMWKFSVAIAALVIPGLFDPGAGHAQTYFQTPGGGGVNGAVGMYLDSNGNAVPYTGSTPLPVTGSFSASLATFVQSASGAIGTPIVATTGGVTGTLPTGASVLLINTSTTYPATCTFGSSDSGAAYFVPASQSQELGVPAGATQVKCTGVGGTATINMVGGTGLFAGAGGGGGGGGGTSASAFAPASIGTPLVLAAGVAGTATLPAGTTVEVQNVGGNAAYCQLGSSSTGITSSRYMLVNSLWPISVGSATQITCLSTFGTTFNLIGGSGAGVDLVGTAVIKTTGALKVDAADTTQPISAASLPLPSGAALEAGNLATIVTNTALTNAGTTAAKAAGIQGVTGGVAVPVSGSATILQGGVANDASHPFYFDTPSTGNLYGAATSALPAQTSGSAAGIGGVKLCDAASTANPLTPCDSVTANGTAPTNEIGVQGGGAAAIPVSITPPNLTTGNLVSGAQSSPMTATTSTQVVALVSSKRLYILRISCGNTSTVPTLVKIQDGSGGTLLDTLTAPASYSGEVRSSALPMFWTTAGNGLYAADATTGASVTCSASGFSG